MKLARFNVDNHVLIGVVGESAVTELALDESSPPRDIVDILSRGQDYLTRLASMDLSAGRSWPIDAVEFLAPIPNPTKFLAIGLNYHSHAVEARDHGMPIPEHQVWFNKQVSCIAGPRDAIVFPSVAERLDYEAELAVVIGQRCRRVSAANALSVVAGYMVTNDVTARDWQFRTPTWTLGKSFDTHGPMGPWLTTADEIANPQALAIKLWVNGELRQDSTTEEMIYRIGEQIEYLSTVMTLEPGDIIATGTPAGVGIAMKPPQFLQVGDIVRTEIEGLGFIENKVVLDDLR
jgi:2-keto-4-pentenoate hydratase/2-oxohepta-3-ene-1,7-dioic acid hydratase in catechol pathway